MRFVHSAHPIGLVLGIIKPSFLNGIKILRYLNTKIAKPLKSKTRTIIMQIQQLEKIAFQLACQQAKDESEFLNDKEARAFIANLPQFLKVGDRESLYKKSP